MAKRYTQTFIFPDGTAATLSAEEYLEKLLRQTLAMADAGDRRPLDRLLTRLARGENSLISHQLNLPQITSRVPGGEKLAADRVRLLAAGISASKVAGELAERYCVTAGHIRRKLKEV